MAKFEVSVNSLGSEAIPLVKTLRTVGVLGLADAKGLLDYLREHAPCVVVAGIEQDVADHVAQLFREAGAEAVVADSSVDVPMVLCPEAGERRRWSWLSGSTRV